MQQLQQQQHGCLNENLVSIESIKARVSTGFVVVPAPARDARNCMLTEEGGAGWCQETVSGGDGSAGETRQHRRARQLPRGMFTSGNPLQDAWTPQWPHGEEHVFHCPVHVVALKGLEEKKKKQKG